MEKWLAFKVAGKGGTRVYRAFTLLYVCARNLWRI